MFLLFVYFMNFTFLSFELTCSKIANSYLIADNRNDQQSYLQLMNEARANLSAQWTMVYQLSDIAVFMSLTLIPIFLPQFSIPTVISWICVLGVCTAILGLFFDDLGDNGTLLSWEEVVTSLWAVPQQFQSDCRVSLLAPFVFGFGITTAMLSYYINGTVVSMSSNLGDVYIGILEAFSYFVAATSAYPFAWVSNNITGGQHLVFQFGSLSFLLSGAVVMILSTEQLSIARNVLLIRTFYGFGRGVFEGACRAVYAEFFTGPELSTAFSGQTLLAGLSGGLCFFAYSSLSKNMIALITVMNGLIALGSYSVLLKMNYLQPISWRTLWYQLICRGDTSTHYSAIVDA